MIIKEGRLTDLLPLSKREIISITGGGGKTSLSNYLARELQGQGKAVISTTTTKIFPPRMEKDEILLYTSQPGWLNKLDEIFRNNMMAHIAVEIMSNGKLKGITLELCNEILYKSNVEYLIIEADGSKGKPLKAHNRYEPVVPENTNFFIAVIGLDCLNKRLDDDICHRKEIFCSLLNCSPGELISIDLIYKLFNHSEGYLKSLPKKARALVFINKVHEESDYHKALELGEKLLSIEKISGILLGHLKPPGERFTLLSK